METDHWTALLDKEDVLKRQITLWRWVASLVFFAAVVGWYGLCQWLAPSTTLEQFMALFVRYSAGSILVYIIPLAYLAFTRSTISNVLIAVVITAVLIVCMAEGARFNRQTTASPSEINPFDRFDPPAAPPEKIQTPPIIDPYAQVPSADAQWKADVQRFLLANCQFLNMDNKTLWAEAMQPVIDKYPQATNDFLLNVSALIAQRDPRFRSTQCQ